MQHILCVVFALMTRVSEDTMIGKSEVARIVTVRSNGTKRFPARTRRCIFAESASLDSKQLTKRPSNSSTDNQSCPASARRPKNGDRETNSSILHANPALHYNRLVGAWGSGRRGGQEFPCLCRL